MKISGSRILLWILCAFLAGSFAFVDHLIDLNEAKTVITVNAPKDMQRAFKYALSNAGNSNKYKLSFVSNQKANVIVSSNKTPIDIDYKKFAYSPFVIACTENSKRQSALIDSKVLMESALVDGQYDIDFSKVIEVVIGDSKWKNLGVDSEELDELNIIYPSKDSNYWKDFQRFMLININGGKYPSTPEELVAANEIFNNFIASKHTEEISNYLIIDDSLSFKSLLIIPEKELFNVSSNTTNKLHAIILYPKFVYTYNYYVKFDDMGAQAFGSVLDLGYDFFDSLADNQYRSNTIESIKDTSDASDIMGFRNSFSLVTTE